ncbi:MAG: peptidoglycan editing factor PgeF [Proteobacteria bacterium]|uniref:peptidoglycan editing factor PgeF n=1 Tax=Ottowia sp. TaxID=1898956 RepID=UPI001D851C0E|nr:peptidoglycan editing factor PgeF [Ottowia sp.]MBS0403581.1 peptidoglycan editing factor PgeF [Pseudomonadota bacterium]MBS0414686.1 peptidoglycan editing factor PgeF [Pseudomonadota bacterium]
MMRGAEGLVPDWPAPPSVRAVFSTRGQGAHDGASIAPFDFFNLGDHVGDDPAAVAANRERLRRALGARPIYLNQVHGSEVLALRPDTPDGARADAAVTDRPGLVCTVMVADCLPVLFTDLRGRAVAAAHAGWRGLAGGVLESTLKRFRALTGMQQAPKAINKEADEIIAWLGPCIGPQAFEVGPEVRAAFVGGDAGAAACFIAQADGKYLADLPALARRRLAAAGVAHVYGNDGSADWCTVGNAARFFSYRRDQRRLGGSGRMAACIWRV